METTADTRRAVPASVAPDRAGAGMAADLVGEHPLGPHAAQILATEHWSLLSSRSLIWNEAMSRTPSS